MNSTAAIKFVFSRDIICPYGRIEVNDGIEIIHDNIDYLNGAVIPKPSFQPIDKAIFGKLKSQPSIVTNTNKNFAGVINLEKLASPFFNLNIQDCETVEGISSITQTKQFAEALEFLLRELNAYFLIEGEIKVLGISIKKTSLQTVTIDRKINRRIGLHLDSWDKSQLNMRDNARNRICINLGQEARYFVFVNKTVNQILTALKLQPSEVKGGSELGRMYLIEHQNQPIIKLKVNPGEAYIAPTENIIHDGTTTNKTKPDIALTLLGNFWVRSGIVK